MHAQPVLVVGATGYVGGRLTPRLLQDGNRVRVMARSIPKAQARSWAGHPLVEIVEGDALDKNSLIKAARGCWAGFYLVHSMNPFTPDFEAADRRAAENMAQAADEAGLERLIYLGGLATEDVELSPHLRSRTEVGAILQAGPVPTTVLRAAMIMGSGSASFEILRYLTERLPVMIVPPWVDNEVQPICIRNVINYLAGCLEHEVTTGQTLDIGGPEIVTYRGLFKIYAEEAGLRRRLILTIPFVSPAVSAWWIHLITPLHISIVKPLVEGLRHRVVCTDDRIRTMIPQDLMDCRRAIKRILFKNQRHLVETCWMDSGLALPSEWAQDGDEKYSGGAAISFGYEIEIEADPKMVWDPLVRIGGRTGWYFADFLWRLRSRLDKLAGGVGGMRGRRHPSELEVGDALDFWRVLDIRPERRLLLAAEMKAPGEAFLDFRLIRLDDRRTKLQMIGRFLPRGLWGLAYWYALVPFHAWIFKGMLNAVAQRTGGGIISPPVQFDPNLKDTAERGRS